MKGQCYSEQNPIIVRENISKERNKCAIKERKSKETNKIVWTTYVLKKFFEWFNHCILTTYVVRTSSFLLEKLVEVCMTWFKDIVYNRHDW